MSLPGCIPSMLNLFQVISLPGCVLPGYDLSGLCLFRVMSLPGYVSSRLSLFRLCPSGLHLFRVVPFRFWPSTPATFPVLVLQGPGYVLIFRPTEIFHIIQALKNIRKHSEFYFRFLPKGNPYEKFENGRSDSHTYHTELCKQRYWVWKFSSSF